MNGWGGSQNTPTTLKLASLGVLLLLQSICGFIVDSLYIKSHTNQCTIPVFPQDCKHFAHASGVPFVEFTATDCNLPLYCGRDSVRVYFNPPGICQGSSCSTTNTCICARPQWYVDQPPFIPMEYTCPINLNTEQCRFFASMQGSFFNDTLPCQGDCSCGQDSATKEYAMWEVGEVYRNVRHKHGGGE